MFKIRDVREFGGVERFKQVGVYVGRPGVFGNPFRIGVHGDRDQVIELYRKWLWAERKRAARHVWAALAELRGDELLGCWCRGQRCHAEVLASAWGWQQAASGEL